MTHVNLHSASGGLCAALAAGLVATCLLAAPAQAQRISLSDLLNRIVALEGAVSQLQTENGQQQNEIAQLQADLAQETTAREAADAALQALIDALPTDSIPGLQAQINALQADSIPGLADHVSVNDSFRDLDGDGIEEPVPTVLIEGANVQVVDGSGSTYPSTGRPSGLGNLIVGYDEAHISAHCSDGAFDNQADCETAGQIWAANQKNGSHNLVVGPSHFYSQAGGVVFGQSNVINGRSAVITGGSYNTASARNSSVSGGYSNAASGWYASVSGGFFNTASGGNASVSGGSQNTASGTVSSVSGGDRNTASGDDASVSGGRQNTASGGGASVSGGNHNTASGGVSSVSGGFNRTASDDYDWVAGGLFEEN